jgi:adenine-specific DNA-methyltransferase
MLADNRFYWGKNNDQDFPRIKRFLSELPDGMVPVNLWKHSDTGTTDEGTKEVVELIGKNIFTFPKPIRLIQRMIQMTTSDGDIVLDFFSGSGTTAHAVMALNAEDGGRRKCISVQLSEKCDEKSEAYKTGYKTIADIAKERIRRVGNKIQEDIDKQIEDLQSKINTLQSEIQTEEAKAEIESLKTKIDELKNQDLGFKVLKLSNSNFKQWQQITGKDKEALEEQMRLFVDPVAKNATTENMVYELLLKSGKDLNSAIELKDGFYAINEIELILILEKANQEIIDAVIASKPQKVIALDKLFNGNDQLKTNASLQMKDA